MHQFKSLCYLSLKGMAMGAADVVPGVSGGTIAFISGIYEELIHSLKSISLHSLVIWRKNGFGAFWKSINGTFLTVLGAGVLGSIVSLAHLVTWLLEQYPEMLWSFFFGLVLSSAFLIYRQMTSWQNSSIAAILLGFVMAWSLNLIAPAGMSEAPLWFVFVSGAVAICAMILPGISGAFILILMGMYGYVVGALKSMDFPVILTFATGCAIGLISFSRVLSFMFRKYHDQTLALLTGFMLGSLNKIWPWKVTVESWTDHKGRQIPLIQENISPLKYEGMTQQNPYLIHGILLMAAAVLLVSALEKFRRMQEKP